MIHLFRYSSHVTDPKLVNISWCGERTHLMVEPQYTSGYETELCDVCVMLFFSFKGKNPHLNYDD